MRLVLSFLLTAAALVCSIVFYAWAREFQRRTRTRCVTANAAIRRRISRAEAKIEALYAATGWEYLPPAADDSPDADTDEIPVVQPDTEPLPVTRTTDAVAARRAAAWDDPQRRPSPAPRDQEIEWVERNVNIGGTVRTFRIPAGGQR